VEALPKPVDQGQALNTKRRETAAAVANMKERLRAMGILNATITPSPPAPPVEPAPPLPPSKQQESSRPLYPPTPPRISNPTATTAAAGPVSPTTSTSASSSITAIKLAADQCRQSLRDLDIAKERAMASLREFMTLQEQQGIAIDAPVDPNMSAISESESLPASHSWMQETSSILRESISQETKQLVREYQQTIQSMNLAMSQSLQPTARYLDASSSSVRSNSSSQEMSGILEKYSDRLLELVSSKIADKITR
jgi:hypothetical protein